MLADLTPIFNTIASLDKEASHTDANRKEDGITYTPPLIVRHIISLVEPAWHDTIHEPSCGRGMFAFGLVEYWLNQGKTVREVARWAETHLYLCDTDAQAISDLKALWKDYFSKQGVNADTSKFIVSDGLFGDYADLQFDIIVGNPPYVRIQNLSEDVRRQIRDKFPSCAKGNVDLYYAFFEDALNRAKRVGYIMPNSWFSNSSAKGLREKAFPFIQSLIDFGSTLVFAPVRAYTAIVITGRTQPELPIRVSGQLPSTDSSWAEVDRLDLRWSQDGWTPLLDREHHQGYTLGDHVHLVSGIATLSDKSYILPNPVIINRAGKLFVEQADFEFPDFTLCVPIEFAPRLIKATRAHHIEEEGPRILCPYDENWALLSEETLLNQAPDLIGWLERRKTVLDNRDKGKTSAYGAWYAYGRRQGFWTANPGETVLLVPQMGNGKLTSIRVDLSKTHGRFLFTSGYVLRMKNPNEDLSFIEQQLGTDKTWDFVRREGKAWAGGGDYRTIGARDLRRLPLF